jgi:RNA polymerase sigma-70 factor (ECF subfamily)
VGEVELIQRSQKGDLEAFNQLVEAYQTVAYNLALRMLGHQEAAQDATQEAFLAAWRGIKGFRGGNFRAWILHIVANACRDELRRLKRRPATSLDALTYEPTTASPQNQLLGLELGEHLRQGLARLPYEQRLAVVLCDIQGFSYQEIAQIMDSSVGTVRSRLSQGRAQLRDYLMERGTFGP